VFITRRVNPFLTYPSSHKNKVRHSLVNFAS
jgi:hypothetical protein